MGRLLGLGSPLLGLAIGLAPQASLGEPSAQVPVSVDYSGHSGCPGQSAFIEQLQLRSHRVEPTRPESADWRFVVFIVPEGSGSRGVLRIVDPAGRAGERAVSAATCGEVLSALALVAALSADPEAVEPKQRPTGQRGVTQPPQPDAPRPTDQPIHTARGLSPPDRTPTQASRQRWWSVGYEFGGTTAVAPGFTLTQRLFVEAGQQRPEWLVPAVRLSVASIAPASRKISTQVTETDLLETRVKWRTGRLEGSMLLLRTPDRVAIRPAVYLEAGSYQGEFVNRPGDITPRADRVHLWLATGVAAHTSIRVVGPLVAQLSAGAFVSFFGNSYTIKGNDPSSDQVVYDVPPLGVFISAAIGLTTP